MFAPAPARGTTRLSIWSAFAVALLMCLSAEIGCKRDRPSASDSESSPGSQPEQASTSVSAVTSAATAAQPSDLESDFETYTVKQQNVVRLIQITEVNQDTLPEQPTDYQFMDSDAIRWEENRLIIREAQTEPKHSAAADDELADFELSSDAHSTIIADAPLAECVLFVRYEVFFEGTCRSARRTQWYAFKNRQGEFQTNLKTPQPTLTYDPNHDVPPFPEWLEQLRLGDQLTNRISINATHEPTTIQWNETSHQIESQTEHKLSHVAAKLKIIKLPLHATDLFGDEASAAASDAIFPGETFDSVTLTTTINAIDLGDVPMMLETFPTEQRRGTNQ